jgi:hypothetical protein
MLLSLLRNIVVAPSKPVPPTSNASLEGIEVHGPGGTKLTYTPSDRAEAPVDFGAGVAVGAVLFGAAFWPALAVGTVAGAAAYVIQEGARAKPTVRPLPGGNGSTLPSGRR